LKNTQKSLLAAIALSTSWRRDLDIQPMHLLCGLNSTEQLSEVYSSSIEAHRISDADQAEIHAKYNHPNASVDLKRYTRESYPINNALWNHHVNGTEIHPLHKDQIRAIDRDIPIHHTDSDIPLFTGVKTSPANTAVVQWNSTRPIKLITLPAYTSATTHINTAIRFSSNDNETLHHESDHHGIILPNAKHIIQLHLKLGMNHQLTSAKNFSQVDRNENEIILGRHYDFELHPRPDQIGHNPLNPVYLWHAHSGHSSPFRSDI
jgi:hypothetical protein